MKNSININAILDAVLSALCPGLGQLVQGKVCQAFLWLFSMGLVAIIFFYGVFPLYLFCIYNAYTGRMSFYSRRRKRFSKYRNNLESSV